jgi:nicotinamidase-related amidase
MAQPRTLLQIAGVASTPGPWRRSALVLIDCQREYRDGALPLAGIEKAVTAAQRALDSARRYAAPVIHVKHRGRPGGALFAPDGPMWEIMGDVAPTSSEPVIEKGLPNAFAKTELEAKLRASGRSDLILVGFATHMCVSSTARAALDLGFRTTIIASATATRDLPDGQGGVISAAELQRVSLVELADRFATVVPNADAIPE